jgi:hypothetical protein
MEDAADPVPAEIEDAADDANDDATDEIASEDIASDETASLLADCALSSGKT